LRVGGKGRGESMASCCRAKVGGLRGVQGWCMCVGNSRCRRIGGGMRRRPSQRVRGVLRHGERLRVLLQGVVGCGKRLCWVRGSGGKGIGWLLISNLQGSTVAGRREGPRWLGRVRRRRRARDKRMGSVAYLGLAGKVLLLIWGHVV